MCATIFAILSYAFQLAGALLLLLWCIGKCDAKVVKGCFSDHPTPLWMEIDEKGGYTTVSKEDLQDVADILKHRSRKTIRRTFESCNNYRLPDLIPERGTGDWFL